MLASLHQTHEKELEAWEPPLGAMQKRVALEKTRTRTGTTWWVTGFPLWGQRGRAAPYCSWVEWSREAGGYGVTQREAGLNERKQSGRQGRGIRYSVRATATTTGDGTEPLARARKGLSAEC